MADQVVHLIDDDAAVLKALQRLLSGAGYRVECHATAEAFLHVLDLDAAGCAVVDLGLPGMDGLGLQDRLAASMGTLPLIFLTGTGDIPSSVRAMKAGAVDFLTKPVDAAALLTAVSQALRQDVATRRTREQDEAVSGRLASLTPREREVLDHVVVGRLNKQIAHDLGTAEKTVKVHRGRMMRKMQVRTVAELIRIMTLHRS